MLTAAELRELLHYEPSTGTFTWLVDKASTVKAGRVAGGLDGEGYIKIKINYKFYLAHRLAWLYMTGAWPERHIDHINGERPDNRWCNLRPADKIQNGANRRTGKNNTSGIKGVRWCSITDKWQARLRRKHLGSYATKEEAAAAYAAAAKELFGEYARSA